MLGGYLVLLWTVIWSGLRSPARGTAEGGLATATGVFIAVGGLGMPVLNGNRIGQVIAVLIPIILGTAPSQAGQVTDGIRAADRADEQSGRGSQADTDTRVRPAR